MQENAFRKIRILFYMRIVLWVIAIAATVYWIYWSFRIYEMGIHLVEDYAAAFRPIFGKSLLVTAISIAISLGLRRISDNIKTNIKKGGTPQ